MGLRGHIGALVLVVLVGVYVVRIVWVGGRVHGSEEEKQVEANKEYTEEELELVLALRKENPVLARRRLETALTETEDPRLRLALGEMTLYGEGGPIDVNKAERLIRAVVSRGGGDEDEDEDTTSACFLLAAIYTFGFTVPDAEDANPLAQTIRELRALRDGLSPPSPIPPTPRPDPVEVSTGPGPVILTPGVWKVEGNVWRRISDVPPTKESSPTSTNPCGSCYGAEQDADQCCNTCEEVQAAYRAKAWRFDPKIIEQCTREEQALPSLPPSSPSPSLSPSPSPFVLTDSDTKWTPHLEHELIQAEKKWAETVAVHYLLRASRGRNVMSDMALGFRYMYGWGSLPRNLNSACAFYYRAATVAVNHIQATGGAHHSERLRLSELEVMEGDGRLGDREIEHLEQQATQGDTNLALALAQRRFHGQEGVEADQGRAIRLFEHAAAARDTQALSNLGYIKANGWGGVPINYTEARSHFERAIELGDPFGGGHVGLGFLHQHGKGLEKNLMRAYELFKIAADRGNVNGLFNVGEMLRVGQGVPANLTQAMEYYRMAARHNHFRARYVLGLLYWKGLDGEAIDLEEAASLLKTTAEMGPVGKLVEDAYGEYLRGNIEGALVQYMIAGVTGLEVAQTNAAWMLTNREGVRGFAKDPYEATSDWWQMGIHQNSPEAFLALGDFAYYGWGGIPMDPLRAYELYDEASRFDLTRSHALFNMGFMAEKGLGTMANATKALTYYAQSAQAELFDDGALAADLAYWVLWCRCYLFVWDWGDTLLVVLFTAVVGLLLMWILRRQAG